LKLNVKVVAAISPQLFRMQGDDYRNSVVGPADRVDAMIVTNGAFNLMHDWAEGPIVREFSLSADWDDRWRTGGTVDEVIDEAHLAPAHILLAIERFVTERQDDLERCTKPWTLLTIDSCRVVAIGSLARSVAS
jgi:transketolase